MRTEDADSVTSSLAAGHDTPAAHSSQPRLNANRTLPPSHAFYELFPVSDCPRTAQQFCHVKLIIAPSWRQPRMQTHTAAEWSFETAAAPLSQQQQRAP